MVDSCQACLEYFNENNSERWEFYVSIAMNSYFLNLKLINKNWVDETFTIINLTIKGWLQIFSKRNFFKIKGVNFLK